MKKSKLSILSAAAVLVLQPVVSQGAPDPTLPKKKVLVTQVITYNLAAGATSPAYTLPANKSVTVTGNCLTLGTRGVGSATILQVTEPSGTPSFLEWVGLESSSGSSITEGVSSSLGTHILYIDFGHVVDIEVQSANSFRIHNGSGGVRTGEVTLTYYK
ncbi:hypothetical protein [Luteolibacter soli]|uniref:Spore coat protein U domain-containing protein n=1 Tax=Luteolibacter soli TaxID=3135280 RepID=A0ABU9B3A7_9BACT